MDSYHVLSSLQRSCAGHTLSFLPSEISPLFTRVNGMSSLRR
jgi:hypothetical protein